MLRILAGAILLAAMFVPASCLADESCPWLNAATAGGVLEGAVKVAVARNQDDATCDFVRREGVREYSLRIEVATMRSDPNEFGSYAARCGSAATALKAIGNLALACTADGKDGQHGEQVVGRVRDRAFVVRVGTNDDSMRAALREKARKVAEQVAGTLF